MRGWPSGQNISIAFKIKILEALLLAAASSGGGIEKNKNLYPEGYSMVSSQKKAKILGADILA